jgi:hypothetical protein
VAPKAQGVTAIAQELKDLLVSYARQETVDPIKALGRYLAFGFAGALFIGVGGVLFVVAVLRVLQEETGSAFTGNLSWIPYLLTLLVIMVAIGLLAFVVKRTRDANQPGATN